MAQLAHALKSLVSGDFGKQFLRISVEEASFARRGFHQKDDQTRRRLEHVGFTFLLGYNAALDQPDIARLVQQLNTVAKELRGFAFEGASMSLALLDLITPWRRDRLRTFLESGGRAHIYMVYVGVGWALARLQRWRKSHPALIDPLLRWLAFDGYGFHEGYFRWRRFVDERAIPEQLSGYARRVFDQGLGRSIWFIEGADTKRIPATIATFPAERRTDIWSGVGLACAYAGGVKRSAIESLRAAAAMPYVSHLAQGAAFAAKTRQRAGNPAEHTELACEVLCGRSADAAAEITDLALRDLPDDGEVPAYEIWRQRIRAHFAEDSV